jgi:hypothetical protein
METPTTTTPTPITTTNIAASPDGEYGVNTGSTPGDIVSNLYLHTIRAYTSIDQFHDFKSSRIEDVADRPPSELIQQYTEYIYRQGTPEDPIYTAFMTVFKSGTNIEDRFVKSIVGNYSNPYVTAPAPAPAPATAPTSNYVDVNVENIPLDNYWPEFRRRIPEYDETIHGTIVPYTMFKTRTIDITAPGVTQTTTTVATSPESIPINRYIVTKVTLEDKRNIGKDSLPDIADGKYGSFAHRFFSVLDYHAKLKRAFMTSSNEATFTASMESEMTPQNLSIVVDTDKGVISKLIFYDNNKYTDASLNELTALAPMDRTINYITTRESLHDPGSKKSPYTVEAINKADGYTRRNGNIMNCYMEKPDFSTIPYGPESRYPSLSGYLQGKYCNIDISRPILTTKAKIHNKFELIDTGVKARVYTKYNPVTNTEYPSNSVIGKVDYNGGENEVGKVARKIREITGQYKKYNLFTSKRYGDQLQAYVCKNRGQKIKEKKLVNMTDVRSKRANTIRDELESTPPTIGSITLTDDQLGMLYLTTGDRPMCGYSMLIGLDFIYSDASKNTKDVYIFTYAGFIGDASATHKNYTGGQPPSPPPTPKPLEESESTFKPHSVKKSIDLEAERKERKTKALTRQTSQREREIESRRSRTSYINLSSCIIYPTIDVQKNPYENDRIATILDNITAYSANDVLKGNINHPYVSIYLLLSGIYAHIVNNGTYEAEDLVQYYRLTVLYALTQEYIGKYTEPLDIIMVTYQLGVIVSIILFRLLYSRELLNVVMSMCYIEQEMVNGIPTYKHTGVKTGNTVYFNDAKTANILISQSMYLKNYVGEYIETPENLTAILRDGGELSQIFSAHRMFVAVALNKIFNDIPNVTTCSMADIASSNFNPINGFATNERVDSFISEMASNMYEIKSVVNSFSVTLQTLLQSTRPQYNVSEPHMGGPLSSVPFNQPQSSVASHGGGGGGIVSRKQKQKRHRPISRRTRKRRTTHPKRKISTRKRRHNKTKGTNTTRK